MAENVEKQVPASNVFDPLIQSENIAFARADMLLCGNCERLNPPNRPKCMYCANALEVPESFAAEIKPNLRRLEIWESGVNLILREQAANVNKVKAASVLSLEIDDLDAILRAGAGLPLVRVETESEAAALEKTLMNLGITCTRLSDNELAAESAPTRIGGMEFLNHRLGIIDFNTGDVTSFEFQNIALIVQGQITKSRVDSNEKKRRGGKTKIIDESATISDESVLDIYTFANKAGYRIYPTSFDFSCLGDQKGLLARENFGRLIDRLVQHSPKAKLVTNYQSFRNALGLVWEIESRKD